jgi:hypothetical protein
MRRFAFLFLAVNLCIPCSSALAGPIVIDSFDSGSQLDGNGISVSSPGFTAVTDSSQSGVLGGSRVTTLTLVSASNNGNVTLNIPGGSGHLQYTSKNGNNSATGSYNLFYNGSSAFPADFSGAGGIEVDVFSQNNPSARSVFTVTVTDANNKSGTDTITLVGHSNGASLYFPFSAFLGTFDLTNIASVTLNVASSADTNLTLSGIYTGGISNGPNGGGGGGDGGSVGDPGDPGDPGIATPEPTSLLAWGFAATCIGGYGWLRRRRA